MRKSAEPHVETMSTEEFHRSRYVVKGRRVVLKHTSPRTYSKKTSQIRGQRADGIVTIVVTAEDVLP